MHPGSHGWRRTHWGSATVAETLPAAHLPRLRCRSTRAAPPSTQCRNSDHRAAPWRPRRSRVNVQPASRLWKPLVSLRCALLPVLPFYVRHTNCLWMVTGAYIIFFSNWAIHLRRAFVPDIHAREHAREMDTILAILPERNRE